jgi:hypothetical protein
VGGLEFQLPYNKKKTPKNQNLIAGMQKSEGLWFVDSLGK